MSKKILAFVLAFALMLSMAVSPVYAQSSDLLTVKVDNTTAIAGESRVAVGISLENNSGIDGFSFCVEYDSDKLVYADATIDIDGYKVISQQGENSVNLAWTGTDTYTQNGQIATVYFNVPKDVLASEADITITYREGYDSFYIADDYTETDIAVVTKNGKITISALPDSSNTSVTIGNVSATASDTEIVVPISVSYNEGFSGFSFCVNYDTSRLILNSAEILLDGGYKVISYPDQYGVNLAWTDTSPYESNGDIANLHFSLKDDVKSGKAFVEFVFRDGYDSFYISADGTEEDITVDSFDGYVYVNNHTYGEWTVTTPATCTSTGIKERTCSECNKKETAVIPKTEHEYAAVVTPPTCTAQGYTTHTCKTCPKYYIDTYTDITDHTLDKWELNFDAECLVDGEEIQKCTVCKAIINRRAITAPGHSFGEWYTETPAQFHVDGTSKRDCTKCDAFETKRIPKLSESHTHNFTGTEEIIEPATCTTDGSKKVYCSETACGEFTTVTIDATGHTYGEWYEYSAATFDTDGEKRRDCEDCDHYESERIPKRSEGHICEFTGTEEIIDHPTCTENGSKKVYCYDTDCGQYTIVNIDPNGHTAGEWEVKTPATCDTDGEDVKKCTVCSVELETRKTDATNHEWDDGVETKAPDCLNEGETTYTCSKCNGTKTESIAATGHTAGEWTVTEPATCTKAGTKELRCTICNALLNSDTISATGHSMGDWYEYLAAEFNTDGEERKECANCDYYETKRIPKLSESHICDFTGTEEIIGNPTCTTSGSKKIYCTETQCGKYKVVDIDPTGHTNGNWETLSPASCTTDGTEIIKCSVCNTQLQSRPIEATGHTWDNGVITKPADCMNKGEKTFTCTKCDATDVRDIPTGGHSASEWVVTDDPTCTETGCKEKHCTVCNQLLSTETIPSTGHSYGSWTVTTYPTATELGEKQRECSICHDIDSSSIEPTGILPKITVSSTSGSIGSTVKVTISIQDNPGIITASLNINYDSAKLQLVGVEDAKLLNDFIEPDVLTNNPLTLIWEDGLAESNNIGNGTIATLTFQILDSDAGLTDIYITYNDGDIYDVNLKDVFFEIENGQIDILDYISGDVNNDGVVNAKDATLLRRYVAKWQGIEINELAADVNRDGVINAKDATILRRYVAKWSDIELL